MKNYLFSILLLIFALVQHGLVAVVDANEVDLEETVKTRLRLKPTFPPISANPSYAPAVRPTIPVRTGVPTTAGPTAPPKTGAPTPEPTVIYCTVDTCCNGKVCACVNGILSGPGTTCPAYYYCMDSAYGASCQLKPQYG
jgi:hypothetical protein